MYQIYYNKPSCTFTKIGFRSMNIEHISVSRAKSYKQCGYYYKFKYHEKIPNPGVEQFYFTYGKIIHKIAEVYVEEKGSRALGDISNDVLRGKIEIEEGKTAPPLPADYKRRLPIHMRAVQKLTESVGSDGITEHKFRYDLDKPNEKFVTGFIDRVILKNGDSPDPNQRKAWIIDYKTTKKGPFRENKHTIVHDPQLRLYSRVVQKDFGVPAANIKAALYYLEDSDLIGAQYSDESLEKIEEELLAVYNEIFSTNPEHVTGKTGQHCQRCEYKEMCPFFQGTGGRAMRWDGDLGSLGL